MVSSEALDADNLQIKQVKERIAQAKAVIARAEPVRKVKTARLEAMATESVQI